MTNDLPAPTPSATSFGFLAFVGRLHIKLGIALMALSLVALVYSGSVEFLGPNTQAEGVMAISLSVFSFAFWLVVVGELIILLVAIERNTRTSAHAALATLQDKGPGEQNPLHLGEVARRP